jgi:hypothetical protein
MMSLHLSSSSWVLLPPCFLSLRWKASPDESTRFNRQMSNLVGRAEASVKFLASLEGRPVAPEEAIQMDSTFSKTARNALALIDEFYG